MSFNFEEFVKKYYVHPETIEFFKARLADNVQPYYEVGVEEARKQSVAAAIKYGGTVNLDGKETEFIIPSPHCKDGIPVTVYKPSSCDTLPAPGILVYYHGGGNTVGCRKTHETVCKILARDSPCIVVNVEYRLAPEHKYPANIDDSTCALQWVAANKATIGGNVNSKLGVSGDSAGGKLAAIVCHEAKDLVDFAVLVYPSVSYAAVYPSHKEFKDGPVLSTPIMKWFTDQYITDEDKNKPRASVILNKDFSYLPPTQIIVADLDPLRDGCYAYYEKLKQAGVKVELKTIKGVPHAFWSLTAAYKENCREAHAAAVKFIQDHCYNN
ncbi:ethyl acetate hydrolase-like isoform X1 [Ruditapes philippinarum]|uniref:ethyl acetate hydrolase-like isoform X1 n=1 Tax=Ruditapes philippinarum TaxID=129788 RepID=UPI00295B1B0F|nr:ethyl acetate hydrolase-like isoform X1 [Ruditapes philippinarum]